MAAEKLIKRTNKAIIERSINPLGFQKYKAARHKKYNWYRIYVGNYIIFYTVKDSKMIIARMLYQKRNLEKLI